MSDSMTREPVRPCGYCGHEKFADCHQAGTRRERSPCVCRGYIPGRLRTLSEEITDGLAALAAVIPIITQDAQGDQGAAGTEGRIAISYVEILKLPTDADRVLAALEVAIALGQVVEAEVVYDAGATGIQFYARPKVANAA